MFNSSKKKILITQLKKINNKKMAKFSGTSEGAIITWKKENSPKKGMLLSVASGYYLFGEPNPVIYQFKEHLNSLKKKLKKSKQEVETKEEIAFFETFVKDLENIEQTTLQK